MYSPGTPPTVFDPLDPTFLVIEEVFASQNKILPVPIPGIPPIDPALLQNFWLADAELPILINDFEIRFVAHIDVFGLPER